MFLRTVILHISNGCHLFLLEHIRHVHDGGHNCVVKLDTGDKSVVREAVLVERDMHDRSIRSARDKIERGYRKRADSETVP